MRLLIYEQVRIPIHTAFFSWFVFVYIEFRFPFQWKYLLFHHHQSIIRASFNTVFHQSFILLYYCNSYHNTSEYLSTASQLLSVYIKLTAIPINPTTKQPTYIQNGFFHHQQHIHQLRPRRLQWPQHLLRRRRLLPSNQLRPRRIQRPQTQLRTRRLQRSRPHKLRTRRL